MEANMSPKHNPAKTARASTETTTNESLDPPPDVHRVLTEIQRLLNEDSIKRALELIDASPIRSPWLTNAAAVCLLRLGEPERALSMLRTLVVNGIYIRTDAPTVFKTNFATALLLSENLDGCRSALAEIKEADHPAVKKINAAIAQWKSQLRPWQRLNLLLGGQPSARVIIGRPGDLLN